jgi:hypothetical protein
MFHPLDARVPHLLATAMLLGAGCSRPPCPALPEAQGGTGLVTVAGGLEGRGEGMWPLGRLDLLDEAELRTRGLELPLAELWADGGGLGRAVVDLGGCTASFVSADGLLVTNHHCAFDVISRNSTPERNLVDDGFVAASRADERDGYGTTIKVLLGFEDATARVTEGLPEDALERIAAIEKRESELVAACETVPGHRCRVARFNDGIPYGATSAGAPTGVRRYFLFDTLELRDVRLVANPPLGVGEYGGEVDNWHWPRHDGDWSFLRAYVGADGVPADFDATNVPYRPTEWLAVSTTGVAAGELVMVLGYPWSTQRYQTAAEIEEAQEWQYPLRIELFGVWIAQLEAASAASEEARLLNAPTLKGINNAHSHALGMVAALRRSGLLERRRAEETEFRAWVAADPSRARYAAALDGIAGVLEERRGLRDRDYLLRYLARGSQVLGFARTITKWAIERPKPDLEREPGYQDRDEEPIRREMEAAEKSLDLEGDRLVLTAFVRRAMALPDTQRIPSLDEAVGLDRSDAAVEAFVRRLYTGTTLGDTAGRLGLLGKDLAELQASTDEMLRLALALAPLLDESLERSKRFDIALADLRAPLVEALGTFRGRPQYPDANGTLRLTAGTVRGYLPADGAAYVPFTTLDGLLQKETGQMPFASPPAVLEAARRRDYGRWADETLGNVPVNFLSDVDTTGGNSGSPALDGRGRLIGLLFDGVWEDLCGDYLYDSSVSRSILVDFRYVLWYLDRIVGARALLEELGIPAAAP